MPSANTAPVALSPSSPHFTHVVVDRAGQLQIGPGTIEYCYDNAVEWPDADDMQVITVTEYNASLAPVAPRGLNIEQAAALAALLAASSPTQRHALLDCLSQNVENAEVACAEDEELGDLTSSDGHRFLAAVLTAVELVVADGAT